MSGTTNAEAEAKIKISRELLEQIAKGLEGLQKGLGRMQKGVKSKDER